MVCAFDVLFKKVFLNQDNKDILLSPPLMLPSHPGPIPILDDFEMHRRHIMKFINMLIYISKK